MQPLSSGSAKLMRLQIHIDILFQCWVGYKGSMTPKVKQMRETTKPLFTKPNRRILTMWAFLGLLLLAHLTLGIRLHAEDPDEEPSEDLIDFNWTSITPSQDLQYHDCYDGFKCARLQVPLDWSGVDETGVSGFGSSKWVSIGILTVPATVPITDPSFGGTILLNPGGPGGAGTEFALTSGNYYQGIFDREKHYEIIGFDPRGTGASTPSAECYDDSELGIRRQAADAYLSENLPDVGLGDVGFNYHYQWGVEFGRHCAEKNNNPDSIFYHMSTAAVSRDMLEIVNRVDSLRAKEGNTRSQDDDYSTRPLPRLQYYGASYGTVLGNTSLSMFPDRVERMVLDGVADAAEHVTGPWVSSKEWRSKS